MMMRELARRLGVPIRTFNKWAQDDPELTVLLRGKRTKLTRWVKLERLAGRHGITLVDAYMLGSSRWIKATTLATLAGIPRRTMAYWCRTRPGFARRIAHMYYIDLEQFGASIDDVEALHKKLNLGNPGNDENEEDE